jgi:hypothetical protein
MRSRPQKLSVYLNRTCVHLPFGVAVCDRSKLEITEYVVRSRGREPPHTYGYMHLKRVPSDQFRHDCELHKLVQTSSHTYLKLVGVRTCFHHRPDPDHKPKGKLEAAYYKADKAIQRIVDLLAA